LTNHDDAQDPTVTAPDFGDDMTLGSARDRLRHLADKTRPMDMTLNPPAHVWRVAELDPPPDCAEGARPHRTDPKPDGQLRLLDQREGRAHDRKVGA
jgi:hypothetical protein